MKKVRINWIRLVILIALILFVKIVCGVWNLFIDEPESGKPQEIVTQTPEMSPEITPIPTRTTISTPVELPTGKPLGNILVILDPGHGDRASTQYQENGGVFADPGCYRNSVNGNVFECVVTWDISMRFKMLLEKLGATVELTVTDPNGDYTSSNWDSTNFPMVSTDNSKIAGRTLFVYKQLVDFPNPTDKYMALESRASTANRLFNELSKKKDIYYISIHADYTIPNWSGASFYYFLGTGFVDILSGELKKYDVHRVDISTDGSNYQEYNVAEYKGYDVLRFSKNPDSYLIELGNFQNDHDFGIFCDSKKRQFLSEVITSALVKYVESKGY